MDIKVSDQNGSVAIWPEKLHAQPEAETLITSNKKSTDKNVVAGLVKKSNRILVSISSHKFPVDFFPDVINVEEGRVTIITRNFFFNSQVHSVDIKDISNVFINTAPFFAQLVIVSKTFAANEIRIRNLRKKEAVFARRIIEGLRTFTTQQIDTSGYTKEELVAKLKELSTTEIVT